MSIVAPEMFEVVSLSMWRIADAAVRLPLADFRTGSPVRTARTQMLFT
ncbi:hypothetical protein ABIC65_000236 [Sphingomonas trueperi]